MSETTEWQQVALRLGEHMESVGPDGYYAFTSEQWLDWALAQIDRTRQRAVRAERILAALREPSETIDAAACEALPYGISIAPGIRAAVEAAEREADG